MVLMTMIARVADGLPLAASMQEDEQVLGAFLRKLLFTFFTVYIIVGFKQSLQWQLSYLH